MLPGMRIQPADGDPRPLDEPRQRLVGQIDHLPDPRGFHPLDRLAQADVSADVRHGHFRHGQHHRDVAAAAQTGDELGMSLKVRPRHARRFLVHRQGDNARHLAGQGVARGAFDIGQGRGPRLSAQNARRHVVRAQEPRITDTQRAVDRLAGLIDRVNRHSQSQDVGHAHQHRDIAVHHGIGAEPSLREPAHRNLGPDASGVAHRHRHPPDVHGRGLPVHPREFRRRGCAAPWATR